jgi:hypothetical protein
VFLDFGATIHANTTAKPTKKQPVIKNNINDPALIITF